MLDAAQYDALQPIQWPVTPTHPDGCARLFSDGRYYTPSGRARLIPITPHLPVARLDAPHPFLLNTGRIRDQWHTMTRSGRSVRLLSHIAEPFVEIHPEDAKPLALVSGRCSRFTIITAA
jgi:assimilatory nitrate reductase catalytic subunit